MGSRRKNERARTVFFFLDYSQLSIEGFGPEQVLNFLSEAGIALRDVGMPDEMTVRLTVRTSDVKILQEMLGSRYQIRVLRSSGVIPFAKALLRRKGLAAGAVFFAAILFFQQSFIAELRIEGNTGIPEEEMTDVLRDSGLFVGCRKSEIDPEEVKASLYASFPEITWIGLDLKGALAVIEVAKGDLVETEDSGAVSEEAPCDIVAAKSGYIKEIIVRHGTPLVEPGDYVEEGDVLIQSQVTANNTTYDESRNEMVNYVHAAGDVTAVVIYKLEAQFDRNKFSRDEMEKSAESAVRKYIRENIPQRIEILKKDLKFTEEENIIRCGITLEISENIGYEKEIEFAGT